jgi:cysteinyl-tRNA synthetase
MQKLASETSSRLRETLNDDLNTAQAQAAIFEMIRQANAAFDADTMKKDDIAPLLASLAQFDEVFAVLDDDDAPKMKRILDWAVAEGREKDISEALRAAVASGQLSDAAVDSKIVEMKAARTARDFKTSDRIRAELIDAGILVEITKDGIRWRRK